MECLKINYKQTDKKWHVQKEPVELLLEIAFDDGEEDPGFTSIGKDKQTQQLK